MKNRFVRIAVSLVVPAMLAISAAPAHAESVTTQNVPFVTPFLNPCTPDAVVMEGHVQVQSSVTQNGNGFHVDLLLSAHGTGIGLSGDHYTLLTTEHSSSNDSNNGGMEFSVMFTDELIRQGFDQQVIDDFYVDLYLHMTVNANGEVTSDVSRLDPRGPCR